jgi:hypothetical protein
VAVVASATTPDAVVTIDLTAGSSRRFAAPDDRHRPGLYFHSGGDRVSDLEHLTAHAFYYPPRNNDYRARLTSARRSS